MRVNGFSAISRYPRKTWKLNKAIRWSVTECTGVLLPERAIRLQNKICVLRYVCIGCDSRSYALKTGSRVRVYPSSNIESVTVTQSSLQSRI